MNPKQLEPVSHYAQYDTDGEGIVSDEEIFMFDACNSDNRHDILILQNYYKKV